MELRAKYTLFAEGARGNLSKQLIAKFGLAEGREPQKFGLGLKELWQVAPDKHKPGLVQHSFGWPLDNSTGGGSFLYHFDDNLVSVGFVVHLNYANPYLSPFEEFQRFKTHPLIRGTFEGGKRLSYGARAITEGGYQSVPKLSFPGGALIGCAAGFVNVPRIKGSHNAILSGMLAAEHVAEALSEGRANDELASYDEAWRDGDIGRDLWKVRNAKPLWSKLGTFLGIAAGGLDMWSNTLGFSLFGTLGHGKPDAETLKPASRVPADRLSEARRQAHLRPAVVGVSVQHQSRGRPAAAPACRRHGAAKGVRARRLCRSLGALLPGRRLRVGRGGRPAALRDQRAELRPLQNLRHQGPQPQHHLGAAGGRRRAEIFQYVIAVPSRWPRYRHMAILLVSHRRRWHTAPCGSGAKRPFCARLEGLGAPPPMEAATRDCSYPVPTPRGRRIRRRYLAFAGFACRPGSRARRPDFDLHAVGA